MDSTVSFVLGFSLPTLLLCATLWIGSRLIRTLMDQSREREEKQLLSFQAREAQFLLQIEGLLNRAQARTWEQFTQASSAMQVLGVNDPTPVGLSDEEELRRMYPNVDFSDMMSGGGIGGYDGDRVIGTAD